MNKQFVCTLTLLFLFTVGCVGVEKIVIPSEPKLNQVAVYAVEGGIYIDKENIGILVNNLKAMRAYQEELLRLLKKN